MVLIFLFQIHPYYVEPECIMNLVMYVCIHGENMVLTMCVWEYGNMVRMVRLPEYIRFMRIQKDWITNIPIESHTCWQHLPLINHLLIIILFIHLWQPSQRYLGPVHSHLRATGIPVLDLGHFWFSVDWNLPPSTARAPIHVLTLTMVA